MRPRGRSDALRPSPEDCPHAAHPGTVMSLGIGFVGFTLTAALTATPPSGASTTADAPPDPSPVTRFDNVDLKQILTTDRIFKNYSQRLMDQGKCPPGQQGAEEPTARRIDVRLRQAHTRPARHRDQIHRPRHHGPPRRLDRALHQVRPRPRRPVLDGDRTTGPVGRVTPRKSRRPHVKWGLTGVRGGT
ncbi:hypothetical protein FH965_32205 [Streptomyces spectabilis]|uniref:Uncharacterized protein n=1 Tax=Streptomyces spectabilis TaxID=68270 RepID=A0A516RG58_STRST|nr:hypothetical protein FH965_32205 [Streptomyces spectabilis]